MPPDPRRWQRIQEAFTAALDHPLRQRASFLQTAFDGEPELAAEVEAMLRAHESFGPMAIEKRLLSPDEDLSGTRIGSYRLVRLIAAGGMGEVYEAEREDASFRQRVALKLLRYGLADADARRRFQQERRILARLVHPLVVPIFDGGVTEEGRPYLVLQYVDGQPLTVFCETGKQGLEARLRLIGDVARAVEHAHANLVVHRDLKPANVLVTADAQVRLLDFGVAKLLDPAAGDNPPLTRIDSRIMTVDYAAPEQIRGAAITTATDVYALGALLYELLTGRRPFLPDANGQAALERQILEKMPEAPSAAAQPNLGRHWAKRLRGDLDTIVWKAMAKEPDQRYASAREFASDIARFLAGQPVLARKPSMRYRLKKFVSRNRLASAIAAVSLALVLGSAAAVWRQSHQVTRERDIARSEQEKADRVVAMLVELFSTADPEHVPGGRDITVGEFLKTAETLLVRQQADPVVLARLRHVLGKVYLARSQFQQAKAHLESALDQLRRAKGMEDPATAAVVHDLAKLASQTRPKAEAETLLRQSLDLHRRVHGESHTSVAQCMHDLAEALTDRPEKLALIQDTLALRRTLYPDGHISVAESQTALGVYHYEAGELRRAEGEFEAAVQMARQTGPAGHPSALWAINDLAVIRLQLGQFSEAEQLQRTLLAEKRRIHGDETVPVAIVWGNLGTALAALGKYAECEQVFRTAQTLFVKLLGPEHSHVANATRNLARARMFRGDDRESSALFRQAVQVHLKANGPDHGYWYMRGQAAIVMARLGRAAEAESELRLVLDQLAALGVPPARQSDAQVALGIVLLDTGKLRESETLLRQALEARRRGMPPEHPAIAEAECALGAALAAQGRPEGCDRIRRHLAKYQTWGLAIYAPRLAAQISHP